MNILVSGGTGFIGKALCVRLLQEGHQLVIKTRSPELVSDSVNAELIGVDRGVSRAASRSARAISDLSQLNADESFDVVINLVGEAIAAKRWSKRQKQEIINSRMDATQELIDYFKQSDKKPSLFLNSSAIGFYGIEPSNRPVNEEDIGDDSFSSTLCRQWEECALQAQSLNIRTCLLRTGIVLGKDGGALDRMLFPFKFGLGGRIGAGTQWMPWIHMDDVIGIIEFCIHNTQINGAVNCTAPNPVTNADFTKTLGGILKRPTIFHMPSMVAKLLFGQMAVELLLAGKKVLPVKVMSEGYYFKYEKLEKALNTIV